MVGRSLGPQGTEATEAGVCPGDDVQLWDRTVLSPARREGSHPVAGAERRPTMGQARTGGDNCPSAEGTFQAVRAAHP